MSDKSELSLQSLYELIQTKADKTHTHTFIGSIESALSLQGVTYDRFMRNDLKDQKLKAKFDSVTLGIESNDTTFTIKSERNRATIEVDNHNLSRHNLHITGKRNLDNTVEDVVVSIQGNLLVNNTRVGSSNNDLKSSLRKNRSLCFRTIRLYEARLSCELCNSRRSYCKL